MPPPGPPGLRPLGTSGAGAPAIGYTASKLQNSPDSVLNSKPRATPCPTPKKRTAARYASPCPGPAYRPGPGAAPGAGGAADRPGAAPGAGGGPGAADRHGCYGLAMLAALPASVLSKRLPLTAYLFPKSESENGNRFQNTETETPPKFFYVRETAK